MRDGISNTQYVNLGSLTLSGVTPGLSGYLDVSGFDTASIMVVNGAITDAGTAAGFTATLQESVDTAAASAITATDTVNGGTVTVISDAADNVVAGIVGYSGTERYIGVSVTGTTGTDAVVTLIGVLGKPKAAPVAPAGAVVART
jgi:hypothetical protein